MDKCFLGSRDLRVSINGEIQAQTTVGEIKAE